MEEVKKNWWNRNWKWALPTGGCLTLIICFVVFAFYVGAKVFKSTSLLAFIEVVQEVQKSPELEDALGKPIKMDDLENSDYEPEENQKHFELSFELEGSKADGLLEVIADKEGDSWKYSKFIVTIEDTGEVIDLIESVNE